MKTYLVTGGAGFIGSNYIHYMLKKYGDNIHIINFDALTYAGNPENLRDIENLSNYTFIQGNVCKKEELMDLFNKYEIHRVIHFAAETHVDRSILDPESFANTNIMGTLHLLYAAFNAWKTEEGWQNDRKYLQVSTDEVYGSLNNPEDFFYETTSLDPHSPYSASKTSADLLVKSFIDTYNFPANITRCSNNYGPFQFPEKFIPLIINNALAGKSLPIYGDGRNVRDWLYVMDHAKAIDMVCEQGKVGEIYNVGGHNEKENIEITKLILHTLKELLPEEDLRKKYINNDLITYVKDRKGHDRRYAIAPDKILKEIGWEPETRFEDGIRLTIQWYLENEAWLKHVTEGSYQKYYEEMYQ